MRNLVIAFLLLAVIGLSLHAWRTEVRLNADENEIVERTERLQNYISMQGRIINDNSKSYADSVRDSIEKRLGDLERSTNDLQYIYGKKR